jgi:hypothetical protein
MTGPLTKELIHEIIGGTFPMKTVDLQVDAGQPKDIPRTAGLVILDFIVGGAPATFNLPLPKPGVFTAGQPYKPGGDDGNLLVIIDIDGEGNVVEGPSADTFLDASGASFTRYTFSGVGGSPYSVLVLMAMQGTWFVVLATNAVGS